MPSFLSRLVRPFTYLLLLSLFSSSVPVAAAPVAGSAPAPVAALPAAPPLISATAPDLNVQPRSVPGRAQQAQARTLQRGKLPLTFIPNQGQTDSSVKFHVNGLGGAVFFTPDEVVLALPSPEPSSTAQSVRDNHAPRAAADATPRRAPPAVARIQFDGMNRQPTIEPLNKLPGVVNYFIGNDPTQWRTDIPTYGGIVYKNLYPGIDLRYEGQDGQLKATYVVAPGADPAQIRWRYQGAQGVQIDARGNLQVSIPQPTLPVSATASMSQTAAMVGTPHAYLPLVSSATPQRTVTEQTPVSWQEANGQRTPVSTRYQQNADGSVQFAVGSYDASQPLVLDPTLVYSTYLGGSSEENGWGIAVDGSSNTYVTGYTYSSNFPRVGAQPNGIGGSMDVFVTKINATGTALIYSTVLGGSLSDYGQAIAVDSGGNSYVTGRTSSTDFPTVNAVQGSASGNTDAFVFKLNAAGNTLTYSTYLGGSSEDNGYGITVDSAGSAYLTGDTQSLNFPTASPFQSSNAAGTDVFVTKLNAAGTSLVYSTYLGGSGSDHGYGIALDSAGDAYIAGVTSSTDLPTQNARQTTNHGGYSFSGGNEGLVFKLNTSGSALIFSTYLGGSGADRATAIAVDTTGRAYITGQTDSTDFPTTAGVVGPTRKSTDAFVTTYSADGSAYGYSTYVGGTGSERALGIAVDSSGNASVIGETSSTDFPLQAPTQNTFGGITDVFVTTLDASGSSFRFSTYLGGSQDEVGWAIAVDSGDSTVITGQTNSSNFPTLNPIQAQCSQSSSCVGDAFVAKLGNATLDPTNTRGPEDCQCNAVAPQPQRGGPINTRTGNYWTQTTDLRVETPGVPLAWSRIYASQAITDTSGVLGPGWQHPYGQRLILPTTAGGDVIVYSGANNRLRFTDTGNGTFKAAPGVYSTLAKVGSAYVQTERDQTTRTFDATTGQLLSVRDPQGRRIALSYDTSDRLTTIADASNASRKLTLTYDGSNRIQTVSDGTRTVTYGYTAQGDLGTVQDVMQRTTTYSYQSRLLTKITDPLGQIVEQQVYDVYTPQGKVIQQTLQDGRRLDLQYQADATIVTTTGPDGRVDVERIGYGANNATTGSTLNGQAVLGAGFDGSFSPASVTDGNGQTTTTVYTANGLPTQQTNALGQTTTMQYDAHNNLVASTDAQGVTTRYLYDSLNNVISTTVGLTTTANVALTTLTRYQYQASSGAWSTTETGAVDSRVYEQQAPDGVATRYAYDATSPHRVTQVTLGPGTTAEQRTTYGYDALGRVQDTTSGAGTPLARTDRTEYNADNTIARTIQNYKDGVFDRAKPDEDIVTTYGYDGAGRRIWVQDTTGRYDVTHYDAAGRVDWTAQNFTASGWNGGTTLPALPAYSPARPDQNVATRYGYDGLGRTTLVTQTGILTGTFDPTNLRFSAATTRVTRTDYDSLSRPVTVTLNYRPGLPSTADTNVQIITQYDGAGNPIWQRDALGRWTRTDYDALNRPITVTVNYEDGDPLTGARDADLLTVTRYDRMGRVNQSIDNYVDGVFSATEPITDRVTLQQYDPLGRTITTIQNYDATQTTRTDTNRRQATAYDATTGRVQGQQDPQGRWVSQQYDVLGRVTATIQNCRNASGMPVASGCGSPTTARNVTTQMRYDALGRVFETVDPLGSVTHTVYDGLGRTTQTIQNYMAGAATTVMTNVTTLQQYDALGRTTGTTDATNATTRRAYNALGQTTIITDAAGRVTQQGSDGTGVMRWTKRPDGKLTVVQVDGLGRVVATIQNYQDGVVSTGEPTDQDLITRTVYDAAGRKVQAVDAAGHVTQFAYDNLDRLTGVTENVLQSGCTTDRTDCNITTQYQYDRAGNRTAIIDARGNVRHFAYDAANELVEERDGLNRVTSYSYDVSGRMLTRTDPRGSAFTLTYQYDELNRATGLSAGSSANLAPIRMAYDALGRRTSMTDGTGTTSFGYDLLGRMTSVQAPNTGTVGYQYNARGQRTQLSYPGSGAPVIDYSYLPDGRLDTVQQGSTTLAAYGYDSLGRLQSVARANGATTSYSYDNADRLRDIQTTASGSTLSRFQYTVDRLGLRTQAVETLPFATGATSTPTSTPPAATATSTPTPGAGTTVRINAGGPAVTTGEVSWGADQYASGGSTYSKVVAIANTTDDLLYQTEHNAATSGSFSYAIPVANGSYTVRLHFAEIYFTASGKRVFSVNLEGGAVELPNYDIYADVGANTAVIKRFPVTVTDGTLTIDFTSSVNYAKIAAIEVLPASSATATPTNTPTATATSVPATNTPTATPTATATSVPPTATPTATSVPTTATPTSTGPTLTPTPVSGTRLKTATFENPSLTDAQTGFSTTSGTVERTTTSPIKNTASFRVPNNSTGYGTISFANTDEVFVSMYVRWTAAGTGGPRLLRVVNDSSGSSVTAGNLVLSSSGLLTLRNNTTSVGTGVSLTAGTIYRIGLHQKCGTTTSNAVLEAYLAQGDAPFGTPFASSSTQNLTTPIKLVEVGATNSVTLDATFDDIAVDTGSLPGPSASIMGPQLARGAATAQLIVAQAQEQPASMVQAWGDVPHTLLQQTGVQTRTITYGYDGLNRLTSAQESGGTDGSASRLTTYSYDQAGNRTDGGRQYDAANQVIGWSYDAAGNLLSDGVTTYTYDARNRAVTTGSTTNSYNADGVLVQQGTTRYVQDLAAPLSQILSDGTSTYVYGQERLFGQRGSIRTWYASDALGSVRQTLNDSGVATGSIRYDPWGQIQSGTIPTFGFTGELQQGNNVYLRARWYNGRTGTFTSKDSFAGWPEQPYSLMPYQYAYSAPTTWTDPRGQAVSAGGNDTSCAPGAVFDPVQYRTSGEGCIPILRDTTPPNWYPVDIGIVLGATAGCGLGVGGSAGIETVFDLYDFEVDTFFYGNAGPTTTLGAYVNGYVGLVRGWSGYKNNPGVANYGGISVGGGIGLGAFSLQGGVTPKETGTGAQLKIVTIGAGVSLGVKVTGVPAIDAAMRNMPVSISGGVGKFGTLQDMFPNRLPPTAQIFHAPGARPTLNDAQSLAAYTFRVLNPQLALSIAEIALYNGVAWEMQTSWQKRQQ